MPLVTNDAWLYEELVVAVAASITALMQGNTDVFPHVLQVNNYIEDAGTNKTYPCITLLEAGLQEDLLPGDTEVKHWLAPVNVLIEDRDAPTNTGKKGQYMAWRKYLMDSFRQQLITLGVSATPNMQADVKSRAIFDARSEQYQMVRSHFLLMFWMIEPRSYL